MSENSGSKSLKVVCIEDEQDMLDLLDVILSKRGFEVFLSSTGQEGLDKVAEVLPDLVLLDLMMPDIGGWEVYQKMKADDEMKDIPVIVVTAKAQEIDKVLGLHIAKVDGYITKPFVPKELLANVDKVLGK